MKHDHINTDKHNCIRKNIVSRSLNDVKTIAERLIILKGVKHGKLVVSTTGRELV